MSTSVARRAVPSSAMLLVLRTTGALAQEVSGHNTYLSQPDATPNRTWMWVGLLALALVAAWLWRRRRA